MNWHCFSSVVTCPKIVEMMLPEPVSAIALSVVGPFGLMSGRGLSVALPDLPVVRFTHVTFNGSRCSAAGQTAYVFTAIGTPAPAAEQRLPLNVTWVNLTTGKSGSATLKPRPDINPNGPTTLTAIVDTGSGSILSTIFGQVTTLDRQCQFMPTIGSTVVP